MPSISRPRALAYAAVVLVVLVGGGRLLASGSDPAASHGAGDPGAGVFEAEAADDAPAELVVHVVGAVRQPGLYRLEEGSRVDDAIARAGGATGKAALELVNLASPVADGQQVLVPLRGKGGPAPAGAGGAAGAGGRVHLNTATLEDLQALPGIGPVTAQKILDYREQKGAFQSVDELDAVSGIGPKRLETLRELVDL